MNVLFINMADIDVSYSGVSFKTRVTRVELSTTCMRYFT